MRPKEVDFPSFEILDQHDEGDVVVRESAAQPKLPRVQMMLARLLRRRGFHFVERGRYDRTSRVWRWELAPNVLAAVLSNRGSVKLEAAPEGHVRRIVDIALTARLPGIGTLIEASAITRISDGWNASAVFMNDWLTRRATS